MWFLIALLGYAFLAVVFVLDKLILTKSVAKPVMYTFYSTIFLLGAFLFLPFGVQAPRGADMLWAIVSGLSFGFAMWTMFVAVKSGEASHINPFLGAMMTIATYAISSLVLAERLTPVQLAGVVVFAFASFLLSFEKSRKNHGFHTGFLWATASGILFAISTVAAKYIYNAYPFLAGLIWTRGTTGFFGAALLLLPSVRHALASHRDRSQIKTYGKRHATGIVVANKILSVFGIVLVHYATAIGSVTLVNALIGVQYVLMFAIIYGLTRWFPNVLKEYFTKRELAVETIAIVLVALGALFFIF